MSVIFESLLNRIIQEASQKKRLIVAIAGPPGSGKSTLAEELREGLAAKGKNAQVLPMDGFHLDNELLQERGLLDRKGAPETFDVRGFSDIIYAIRRADEEVLVPIFDRSREITIGSARAIDVKSEIIIAEGNYLLLDEAPWSRLKDHFDLTIFINPGEAELSLRLRQRWTSYGYDEQTIAAKVDGNDMPNGRRVIENSRPADVALTAW